MFNYGAFRKGYVEADTRYKNQRRENARLYNEYVQMNPDASVEDREKYASDLAGNSEFFRAALPSADVMRSNVDRRKKEVEWKETQRRNQTLQTELGFMKSYADILTPFATSGDMQAGFDMLKEVGGFNPKMEKAVTAMAMGAASQGAISTINGRINAWKATGFQQDKIEDIFAGLNPNLPAVQQARTQVDAMTQSEIKRQEQALQEHANRASGNDEDFNMLKQNAAEKYPLIPAGRHDEIIANYGQQKFDARKKAEDNANQAIVKSALNKVRVALEANQIIGIDQAKAELESILAQTTLEDKSYNEDDLAKLVTEQEERNISQADELEEAQKANVKSENEGSRQTLDADAIDDRLETLASELIGDVSEFDKKFDMEKAIEVKKTEIKAAIRQAGNLGLNLRDASIVDDFLAQIMAEESSTKGSLGDILATQRAYSRTMANMVGDTVQKQIERTAFNQALDAMGVTSFEEIPSKSWTTFNAYFKTYREQGYETQYNKIDPEVLNVTALGEMYQNTLDGFDKRVATEVNVGDYTERTNEILRGDVKDLKDVTSLNAHLADGQSRVDSIVSIVNDLERQIAMADAYIRQPTEQNPFGFGRSAANQGSIQAAEKLKAELQAKLKSLVGDDGILDEVINAHNKVEAQIEKAKNLGMSTMITGDTSAIKTLAPELGGELEGKSPQQQIEIIKAKAEEITKQMIIAWTAENPNRSLSDAMQKGELKNVNEVAQELFNAYLPQQ